ncbi:MAG: hypothetical protein LBE62_15410 [Azonexus sp.]|jgi:hypothetical protein|nr:hypothetical protein [Azonexus sp.]
MFASEYIYRRACRKGIVNGRYWIQADGSKKLWPVTRQAKRTPEIYGRDVFAQNDAYLELCNPGWEMQEQAAMILLIISPYLLFIFSFYGFAIHPLFTGKVIFPTLETHDAGSGGLLMGWLFFFLSLCFCQWFGGDPTS